MRLVLAMKTATMALLIVSSMSGCMLAQTVAKDGAPQKTEGKGEKVILKTGPDDKREKDVHPGKIDEDANPEFITTSSGLKYRILRKSDKRKPNGSDTVTVHYKGWLDSEIIFDSSYRRSEKSTFPLTRVVKAWTEGLQLIGEGGMIELEVPPELGYGSQGKPPVPPNATMHFLIELFKVGG